MGISVQILTIEGSLDWFDHGYALSHGQYDLLCSLVILHILVEVVQLAASHIAVLVVEEGAERVICKYDTGS